ncbi:MAG: hypothetical protein V1853_02735 [bacterium]
MKQDENSCQLEYYKFFQQIFYILSALYVILLALETLWPGSLSGFPSLDYLLAVMVVLALYLSL